MRNSFFILFSLMIFLGSCKNEAKVQEELDRERQAEQVSKRQKFPSYQADYLKLDSNMIEKYQAAYQQGLAPVLRSNQVDGILFPHTDWFVVTFILKESDYTNDDINKFLKYGAQLDKEKKLLSLKELKTKRGVGLSTTEVELINLFGKPTVVANDNSDRHLKWKFRMKSEKDNTIKLTPFVQDDLDLIQEIDAYFQNGRLKALIYLYELP